MGFISYPANPKAGDWGHWTAKGEVVPSVSLCSSSWTGWQQTQATCASKRVRAWCSAPLGFVVVYLCRVGWQQVSPAALRCVSRWCSGIALISAPQTGKLALLLQSTPLSVGALIYSSTAWCSLMHSCCFVQVFILCLNYLFIRFFPLNFSFCLSPAGVRWIPVSPAAQQGRD